jgi:CubicO group peptidase (beta-lactamase class C family)
MYQKFRTLAVTALLLPTFSRGLSDSPDPQAAHMDSQRLAQVRARMQEYVDEQKAAGMVTVVARHGRIASFEAVGFRDLENKQPMQKDTLFQIMSLTKPVTCAGIMILADEGRLSVRDPVEKFLPEYKNMHVNSCQGGNGYGCNESPAARPINVEDLMTHTSGLGQEAEAFADKGAPASLAELASRGAKASLLFQPGTAWNYSNMGYDILGRIIEIVSKRPYDGFLKERIFDPLGMKDTTFTPSREQISRLALLYSPENGHLVRSPEQFSSEDAKIPHPAGGLISSALDMLRFNLMIANRGVYEGKRILSSAAVHLMTIPHTGDMKAGWVPGVGHGYGYEVVRDAAGEFRYNSIGSSVKGGAFRTYESIDPEKDLVGVFMMQLTDSGDDMADEITSFIQIVSAAVE